MHCNIIGKTQRDPAGLAAEPLPQLEINERQVLQGILRLHSGTKAAAEWKPGSSWLVGSVNKF